MIHVILELFVWLALLISSYFGGSDYALSTPEPIIPQPAIETAAASTAGPRYTEAPATSVPSTGGRSVGVITWYYCQAVPGGYVGDGGGYCGHFANGEKVTPGHSGVVVACGTRWALGEYVDVPGYGVLRCVDRGHLAYNQVDVFFYTNAR